MSRTTGSVAALSFTNARGVTYFLCSVPNKAGKLRLVASRSLVGTPLHAMPAGFEFAESVNGLVSVRKVRDQPSRPRSLTRCAESWRPKGIASPAAQP